MPTQSEIQEKLNKARTEFVYFIKFLYPEYQLTPFHKYLIQNLQDLIDGKLTRLAISLPPRHGKSFLCSKFLPLFLQMRNPKGNVLGASYSADFSRDEFGKKLRRIYAENESKLNLIFPDSHLDQNSQDGNFLYFKEGGMIYYSSWQGGFTGRSASNAIVIDDVLKNSSEAKSQKILDEQWDWFFSTAMSRLETPKVPILILHTRWSEQDLIGRIVSNNLKGWKYINIPALCTEKDGDMFGRKYEDPLWANKIDKEYLLAQREGNPYQFSALYQGNPVTKDGNLIKDYYFNYYTEIPKLDPKIKEKSYRFSTWDTASKDNDSSCYSVRIDWEIRLDEDRNLSLYALDLYRSKPDINELVTIARDKWNQGFTPVIEEANSGVQLIQILAKEYTLNGLIRISPTGKKIEKLHTCLGFFNDYKVYLPSDTPWVSSFLSELQAFPYGTHDDQVDALRIALQACLFHLKDLIKACKRKYQKSLFGDRKNVSFKNTYDKELYGVVGKRPMTKTRERFKGIYN